MTAFPLSLKVLGVTEVLEDLCLSSEFQQSLSHCHTGWPLQSWTTLSRDGNLASLSATRSCTGPTSIPTQSENLEFISGLMLPGPLHINQLPSVKKWVLTTCEQCPGQMPLSGFLCEQETSKAWMTGAGDGPELTSVSPNAPERPGKST